jgi:hypothetical protein
MYRNSSDPRLKHFVHSNELSKKVARELVALKLKELQEGVAKKDVLSLISTLLVHSFSIVLTCNSVVKANESENPDKKLTDEEVLAQLQYVSLAHSLPMLPWISSHLAICRVILLAGHETTSNTIGWILYELARQPTVQQKLRQEIRKMKEDARVRGQTEVTMRDVDAMPYLLAVVKVSSSQWLCS